MLRMILLAWMVLGQLACAAGAEPAADAAVDAEDATRGAGTDRPNVVFILIDDYGWMDTGYGGSTFYETPNVDALAARGVVFTDAYAACPVCSPTRASIMSGKYPARMDTTDWFGAPQPEWAVESEHWADKPMLPATYVPYLPLEEVTLAEAFDEAGYETGFFGKWHLGGEGHEPERQGFDLNIGGCHRGNPGTFFAPYPDVIPIEDSPEGEFLPVRLADEAASFIADHAGEPKLVYFSMYMVHTPLEALEEDIQYFRDKREAMGLDEDEFGVEGEREVRLNQRHAVYAAMVKAMDDAVGTVVRAVEDAGELDHTIFVFFSDNGGLSTSEGSPTSNMPLRAGKGWLYEGGIREPCIIVAPAVAAPGTSALPVVSNDFYPTLLDLAGLPLRPEQHMDGISLRPFLEDRVEDGLTDRPIFWHYPHYGNQGGFPGAVVRRGDWKLVRRYGPTDTDELYNLADDLGETNDLIDAEPEKAAELVALLEAWLVEVDAQMPEVNPNAG